MNLLRTTHHARFGRSNRKTAKQHANLVHDEFGIEQADLRNEARRLRNDAREGGERVTTIRGDGFHVRLNARAPGAIGTGDGENGRRWGHVDEFRVSGSMIQA